MGHSLAGRIRGARRRQSDRTEISDQRLTAAAVHLLVREGLRGTTLAALGRQSGYSRGLATHRFGSKAGLLRHVLHDISYKWLALLAANVATKVGVEALCACVDAQLDFLQTMPNEVRAMYLLWFTSIDPSSEYRANVRHVHEAQRRDIERWVRLAQAQQCVAAGVDPEREAQKFCASMFGIAYQWLVNASMPIADMHLQLKIDIRARLEYQRRNQ